MQHFCDPMDYSLPGSPVHRIFQASTLGCCPWPGESGTWLMTPVSCQWGIKQLLVYPSLAFALCPSLVHALDTRIKKKKKNTGLPFPTPGDLPDLGIEPLSPTLAGEFFATLGLAHFQLCASRPVTHSQEITCNSENSKGPKVKPWTLVLVLPVPSYVTLE